MNFLDLIAYWLKQAGVTIYADFSLFFQIYYEFLQIPGGGRRVPASGEDKHILASLGVT